jgi:hypothetical protein
MARKRAAHFCQVRFLWRFAFKRFLRLCLFIFSRRFFFRLPMVRAVNVRRAPSSVKRNYSTAPAPAFERA